MSAGYDAKRVPEDSDSDEATEAAEARNLQLWTTEATETVNLQQWPRRFVWQHWAVLFVLVSCCFTYFAAQRFCSRQQKLPNFTGLQRKQQIVTGQGGTLESGPGCPSQCGSFVACDLEITNRNNLLPLLAMNVTGFIPLPSVLVSLFSTVRLFNKQITLFQPDFQCPGTDCWIPNAFLNDDFCDCPETCADEDSHTCDSCFASDGNLTNAQSVGCPEVCGSLTSALNAFTCLGTGSTVSQPFVCPNSSCQLDPVFVNDNRCDCPDCADEEDWDCTTCPCPTICGLSLYDCDGSGVYSCPVSPHTGQECNIPASLVRDERCNCPGTCDDEFPFFDCDSCTCPLACGQQLFLNCFIEKILIVDPPYVCDGGCEIPNGYRNNGYCDCPQCDDEDDENLDCSVCACPINCNDYTVRCGEIAYTCPNSGCPISPLAVNDNFCDCDDCSDEDAWTCDTCVYGCGPCGQSPPCDLRTFVCPNTECEIFGVQVNDNVCNCPGCEDEANWTCSTCNSGCPDASDPIDSWCATRFGIEAILVLKDLPRCGSLSELLPPGSELQCPGGCPISLDQLEDGLCDCPKTCRDEGSCQRITNPGSCGVPEPPLICARRLEEDWNYSASEARVRSTFLKAWSPCVWLSVIRALVLNIWKHVASSLDLHNKLRPWKNMQTCLHLRNLICTQGNNVVYVLDVLPSKFV